MRNKKQVIYLLSAACLVVFAYSFRSHPNAEKNINILTADTSSFTPNTLSGWTIFSSYLNQDTPDSVEFELLLKQNNLVSWGTDQSIGTITNKVFLPKQDQTSVYDLFKNNTWKVRVTTSGQCYISQLKGQVLTASSSLLGNPFVLPVKVRYKNN